MKIVVVSLVVFGLLTAGIFVGGYLLPASREGTASRTVAAPPDLVRQTILDVAAQPAWRARVASIATGPDGHWTEVTADGEQIGFRLVENTDERIILTFESTRGYVGRWQGDIAATPSGGTQLSVTEQATTASPVGRILSRLFFDPEAFAASYLDELATEVARRNAEAG